LAWPLLAEGAAPPLALEGYQDEGGAIALRLDGAMVDPYFATKALLAAHEAGLDARDAALRWIAWLLPLQRPDGRFDRYCRQGGKYVACAAADADDAMLAVWMELLATFAPAHGMPSAWSRSVARAESHLARLSDPARGVYWISEALPVSLLMDNVEVHGAFTAMSAHQARMGDARRARRWAARAARLRQDILATFWSRGRYRVSTQDQPTEGFYPTAVAQIFPLTGSFTNPERPDEEAYAGWMRENRAAWLLQSEHDYPWGLIVLAAQRAFDRASILCWRARAEPFRHGPHWNVLEEAIYLAIVARFSPEELLAPACIP
jgi:hypothetical protein